MAKGHEGRGLSIRYAGPGAEIDNTPLERAGRKSVRKTQLDNACPVNSK